MKSYFSCVFKSCMLTMLTLTLQVSAESAKSVRLSGHVPNKVVSNAKFIKNVDADTHIPMTFILPLRNQARLEKLIEHISDPTNHHHYGKYLTSQEFTERFAPAQEDYDHLIDYAKSLGLVVTGTHSNRTLLNVSGPTECIEKAFNLSLHHYQKSDGQTFYAPTDNPEVPDSIASIIHGVVGLDNHAIRHTYKRQKQTTELLTSNTTSNASPSGPGGGYAPNDLLTAYNLTQVSADGSNQIIALFELSGYQLSDINEYTNHFGLPSPQLVNVLVDGGSNNGIDAEVTLDIQLAIALAPKSQIYVYEGPNSDQGVLDTYNRIATDNLAKQVSTSWGLGENFTSTHYLQAENAIFLQMAAHGQTIYAAAGDSGAYDDYSSDSSKALVVDDPASQPYVVGVGGTRLIVNPGSGAYGSELVWNDGLGNGAGGGGVSSVWPIPSWQTNVSTIFSKTNRNVPDVSLNADTDTGYAIYHNGQWAVYGGTSCAAPLWAAFTARINQARVASQQPVLGFANPSLYAIGAGSSYAENFHDITSGNNLYYSAHSGYDNASGWGSFNGANLFATLTNSSQISPPPPPPPQHSPQLAITMQSTTPFIKGQTGTYNIVVSNHGNGATSGAVTVVITLPQGIRYESLSGSGWSFNDTTLTCTQTHALNAGSSYSPITLQVYVDQRVQKTVTATATVSGGGATSSTTTSHLTQTKK